LKKPTYSVYKKDKKEKRKRVFDLTQLFAAVLAEFDVFLHYSTALWAYSGDGLLI